MQTPRMIRVDMDFFDNPRETGIRRHAIVSIGEINGEQVVTFLVDAGTHQYAAIETTSPFFRGMF